MEAVTVNVDNEHVRVKLLKPPARRYILVYATHDAHYEGRRRAQELRHLRREQWYVHVLPLKRVQEEQNALAAIIRNSLMETGLMHLG